MRFAPQKLVRAFIVTFGLGVLPLGAAYTFSSSSSEQVTLTFMYDDWEMPNQIPGPDHELQAFTQETGIEVRRLAPPEGSLNELKLWRELLERESPTPDVYGIDVIWPEILADYFVDLRPSFDTELSSTDPVLLKSYTIGSKLVAMPYHTNVGTLLYRTDLLRKYAYRAPPKTWDELEKMAARIQAGERGAGKKDFWGYVWQGAAGEALTCNALEWQVAEGGGRILEDNGTISVRNPNAIRAWQRAAHWVGSISPPGIVAYREWDSGNVWGAGRAAFHRTWESDMRLARLARGSNDDRVSGFSIKDKTGITSLPGGTAGRAAALGGSGLAISRFSKHPQEALKLIRFLLTEERRRESISEHRAATGGPEIYNLPGILQRGSKPFTTGGWGGVFARPAIVAGGKYEEVTRAYIAAVHSVLVGERGAPDAAASLERELMTITGFKPGPPSDATQGPVNVRAERNP